MDNTVMDDTVIENAFLRAYRGSFAGIRSWQELDDFWRRLKHHADDQWYIYATGETVPGEPSSRQRLIDTIDRIDAHLRQEHEEEYCGIVYVDDKDDPAFIKVYDPNNLGVVCGFSDNPPLPGWIISRIAPVELNAATLATLNPPATKQRWWQRLFKSG
jgi:hypothetical protein